MWRALRGADGPSAPTVAIDGPLIGVKYAAVLAVDGELRFCGTTARSRHSRCYDTDAIATCQQGHDHRPPAWGCTCGFYAHATDQQLVQSWGELRRPYWARLVVELSGRVVEHDRGWRSSRQVVLEASWEDRCETCTTRRADGFGPSDRLPGAVVPRCRTCAGDAWRSVSDVAGSLGTDVRLLPATEAAPVGVPVAPATTRPWGRRVLSRAVVLAAIAMASTALVALGGGPRATSDPSDLVQQLDPHVDLWDPAETARRLADRFDGTGRRAIVLAEQGDPALLDSGEQVETAAAVGEGPRSVLGGSIGARRVVAADERARQPVVTAIALFEPGEPATSETSPCRIVLLRPGLPPRSWAVVPTAASTLDACVDDAKRTRAVRAVCFAPDETASEGTYHKFS